MEGCTDGGTFGGTDDHFIVYVVVSRPDAVWIADQEGIATAEESGHMISSVEEFE